MGEYADEEIDRAIFGVHDFGAYRRPSRNNWSATCSRCGMTGLKWRAEAEGWRLFEDERIEHNRLKPHVCSEQGDPADDFEDLTGDSDV